MLEAARPFSGGMGELSRSLTRTIVQYADFCYTCLPYLGNHGTASHALAHTGVSMESFAGD